MVVISNALETRDGKNAVLISANIETENILMVSSDSSSIRLMSDNRLTVAEYTDKLLRSVSTLYGKPIIKCKYDCCNLANIEMHTANIYIEERANI